MKIQHLFFTSTIIILSIILIIQTRQMQIFENTLNRIENNYSNLNTNSNTNLANLNTSLTNLNSNITNLNDSQTIKQPLTLAKGTAKLKAMRSQPLFLIEVDNEEKQ